MRANCRCNALQFRIHLHIIAQLKPSQRSIQEVGVGRFKRFHRWRYEYRVCRCRNSAKLAECACGLNYRIWQNVGPSLTNRQSQVIYRTNSYTELSTGLKHLVNGQWVASSESIQITTGGGAATNDQHQVYFAADINASNAVHPQGTCKRGHNLSRSRLFTYSEEKWLTRAGDAICAYWRRQNGQKKASQNRRNSP